MVKHTAKIPVQDIGVIKSMREILKENKCTPIEFKETNFTDYILVEISFEEDSERDDFIKKFKEKGIGFNFSL